MQLLSALHMQGLIVVFSFYFLLAVFQLAHYNLPLSIA
jgi:hypothetical protein